VFELKRITQDAIPQALTQAERYRLLNEPRVAESICLDILEAQADHQQAREMLILALTDQFTLSAAPGLLRRPEVIVFLASRPAHVCINEILVTPTHNRSHILAMQAYRSKQDSMRK